MFSCSLTFSYFMCIEACLKNMQVDWGEASMIQAERLLLIEALKETANDRFLLLSDRLAFVQCFVNSTVLWGLFVLYDYC